MPKITALHNTNRAARRRRQVGSPSAASLPQPAGQLRRLPNAFGQAALLEWLGQAPISFHRAYVGIAGGVLPALWLSAAMERVAAARASEFEANGDYSFTMSAIDCETATGLTRAQQARCREELVTAGLLSEQLLAGRGIVYRLHLDRIARKLMAQSAPLAEQIASYEPLPQLPATWVQQA